MLDLSKNGVGAWLMRKSSSFRAAVGQLASRETWTVDHHQPVMELLVEAGQTLETLATPTPFMVQPSLDYLREMLLYVSAPRRLQILEHLDQAGMLHDVNVSRLLLESVTIPPTNPAAADAIRVMANSVKNLEARQLLREIFAPERLEMILRALLSNHGDEVVP